MPLYLKTLCTVCLYISSDTLRFHTPGRFPFSPSLLFLLFFADSFSSPISLDKNTFLFAKEGDSPSRGQKEGFSLFQLDLAARKGEGRGRKWTSQKGESRGFTHKKGARGKAGAWEVDGAETKKEGYRGSVGGRVEGGVAGGRGRRRRGNPIGKKREEEGGIHREKEETAGSERREAFGACTKGSERGRGGGREGGEERRMYLVHAGGHLVLVPGR